MAASDKYVVSTLATTTANMLNREDAQRTKNDSDFSDWKVLVGPTDWEDHLLKKEGADKYRTSNLPNCSSCPGLYELGIAILPTQSGREVGKLKNGTIDPVYIGQTNKVRTRLQQYGRDGAHLGNELFRDVFSRGFSIVYRWAPMDKRDAERKEAWLLKTYDYAWNKASNGTRRPHDVHQKLPFFPQRQKGLKINSSKPILLENGSSFYTNQDSNDAFSRIFKFGRSQPRLVLTRYLNEDRTSICGVALGRGSVCKRLPVEGRKRCTEHKGMKTNVPGSKLTKEANPQMDDAEEKEYVRGPVLESRTCYNSTICGVDLEGGEFCTNRPVAGRQRCEEHKGMRVNKPNSTTRVANIPSVFIDTSDRSLNNTSNKSVSSRTAVKNDSSSTCDATTRDGSFCRRKLGDGSEQCYQHGGARVNKPMSKPLAAKISSVFSGSDVCVSTCGATTKDGSFCRRKLSNGSTRCYQHEGTGEASNSRISVNKPMSKPLAAEISSVFTGSNVCVSTCGATTKDGSFCRRKPSNGSRRCWQHEGTGVASNSRTSVWSYNDTSYRSVSYFSSSCGAITRNGTYCSRAPAEGRRRCWQH